MHGAGTLPRTVATAILAVVVGIQPGLADSMGSRQRGSLERPPDVMWIPTPDEAVDAMLRMARVTREDVVYDLGCGDGKIVIAAARRYHARGVGIEIDADRVKEATANVRAAGVADLVTIVHGDIFDPGLELGDATVVTLFLLQRLNERLKPRLLRELRPGARVVSNAFHMGADWPAERTQQVGDTTIYFWTIPSRTPR